MKTRRLVISILGMLCLTTGVSALAARTYMKAGRTSNVETIAMQQSQNTKEVSVKKETEEVKNKKETTLASDEDEPASVQTDVKEEAPVEVVVEPVVETPAVVYDNLTFDELSAKLNRSLNSTLAGQGSVFASYSLELGVDPYVAVAIALHETGCKWDCSQLVKQCNNVGGMKGTPGCGGSYKSFPTLDAGIRGYLENLSRNYYAVGLTTPELMNSKYAASTTWAYNVNSYVSQIRSA